MEHWPNIVAQLPDSAKLAGLIALTAVVLFMKTPPKVKLVAFGLVVALAVLAYWPGSPKASAPVESSAPPRSSLPEPYQRDVPRSRDQTIQLSRRDNYSFAGGNIGCPNCGNMFCAIFGPTQAGATLSGVRLVSRSGSGQWYRCQHEVPGCNRLEFANPNDQHQSCEGLSSCRICRQTTDGNPDNYDVIAFTENWSEKECVGCRPGETFEQARGRWGRE